MGGAPVSDQDADERDLADLGRPSMPRLWNFLAGGKDYHPARDLGEDLQKRFRQIVTLARHRVAFRTRAVRALAGEYRHDQLLVAGTDMPLHDEVHTIAQLINPEARVVYTDAEKLVTCYAAALFASDPAGACEYVQAGLDDPGAVLDAAATILDLDRPVGVLLINSLDVLDGPAAAAAVESIRTAAAPGSHIAICHLTADHDPGLAELTGMCAGVIPGPPRPRRRADVEAFLDGMTLAQPGFVPAPLWRPDPGPWPVPTSVDLWCGVGVLP